MCVCARAHVCMCVCVTLPRYLLPSIVFHATRTCNLNCTDIVICFKSFSPLITPSSINYFLKRSVLFSRPMEEAACLITR